MTRVHQDGLLDLRLRCDGRRRTVLAARRQRFPLRMTVPMYLDDHDPGMAFVYIQNPTGGVFAGDRLAQRVAAGPGTRVHVTTQSATKLYRADGGHAENGLSFNVGRDAYLEHVPDPLIPQAGADFVQRTEVTLASGGAYVGAETVGPGRRAHGERHAYERVRLETVVRDEDGRELAAETLELVPRRRRPDTAGLLGAHDYLASLLVVAPGCHADGLAARIDARLAGGAPAGASALPGGAGVAARVLCDGAPGAARALRAAWALAREELLGLPLPRLRK